MFRKSSTKKPKEPTPSSPVGTTPRLAFPTTRSRPSSMVDTAALDISADTTAALSSSPSSSIHSSFGTSPSNRHPLSAADRLAVAQKRDAAASAAQHSRTRTSSSTSRSSVKHDGSEASRSRTSSIPSLMKAASTLSPAKPSTVTAAIDADATPDKAPLKRSTSRASTNDGRTATTESAASLLAQLAPRDGAQNKGQSAPPPTTAPPTTAAEAPPGSPPAPVKAPSTPAPPSASSAAPPPPQQKVAGATTSAVLKKPAPPPLVALLADTQASRLIKQGAEAKVYISELLTDSVLTWPPSTTGTSGEPQTLPARLPILLKWRFPKTYRHPVLSNNITASRTIMEARALLRCAKAGVAVPGVRCVDEKEGILGLELIPGKSVREWLGGGAEGEELEDDETPEEEEEEEEVLAHEDQVKLMQLIGRQLATMHEADIVHGDLTTSNMMLRSRRGREGEGEGKRTGTTTIDLERDEVVLIDFGLSSVSAFAEDKAVDLYVLERAFASTHPASEQLFKTVLESYADEVVRRSSSSRKGGKAKQPNRWDEVRKRLEEVRLRGRKRSMVG